MHRSKRIGEASVKELCEREVMLEDILDSLKQERNFALRTNDWPRVSLANERIKETNERLCSIGAALAIR